MAVRITETSASEFFLNRYVEARESEAIVRTIDSNHVNRLLLVNNGETTHNERLSKNLRTLIELFQRPQNSTQLKDRILERIREKTIARSNYVNYLLQFLNHVICIEVNVNESAQETKNTIKEFSKYMIMFIADFIKNIIEPYQPSNYLKAVFEHHASRDCWSPIENAEKDGSIQSQRLAARRYINSIPSITTEIGWSNEDIDNLLLHFPTESA